MEVRVGFHEPEAHRAIKALGLAALDSLVGLEGPDRHAAVDDMGFAAKSKGPVPFNIRVALLVT